MSKSLLGLHWAALLALLFLGGACCEQQVDPFKYKIAIVGNPSDPDIRYDSSQMQSLKDLGFNTLQLNIAWGARPADEPLNLEDILYVDGVGDPDKVAKRLSDIKERARIAKQWGFRTLFHFGAPRVDSLYKILTPELIDVATEKNSIQKKEVVDKYVSLLQRLKREIPELDDIQIYTFDQEAWVGNEFGTGASDRDIPLAERIPGFLKGLTDTWKAVSPEGMVWWEPWEISAGQIYAMIPSLPTENFGLFLHSNIAEVQLSRPVDVWFKNTVRLCSEQGIPVVGEIFMASANEEVAPLTGIAAPRLVAEELDAVGNVSGIAGVKEYYGMVPDSYDPNLLMAAAKLRNLDASTEKILQELAEPYGMASQEVLAAWEASAVGLSVFPWDATWRFRSLPLDLVGIGGVYHRWDIAHIEGSVAPSPSWKSTRRSLFMTTESEVLDPWFFEDIELRCEASSHKLLQAIKHYKNALEQVTEEPYADYLNDNKEQLALLEQVITAIRCYCREANLTYLMRKHVEEGHAIPQNLIRRFEAIMQVDMMNQRKGYNTNKSSLQLPDIEQVRSYPTAEEMLESFRADPVRWVTTNYVYR